MKKLISDLVSLIMLAAKHIGRWRARRRETKRREKEVEYREKLRRFRR